MSAESNCEMCKKFPPCDSGRCCKRCRRKDCNSRQCANVHAERARRKSEMPWYLLDAPKTIHVKEREGRL